MPPTDVPTSPKDSKSEQQRSTGFDPLRFPKEGDRAIDETKVELKTKWRNISKEYTKEYKELQKAGEFLQQDICKIPNDIPLDCKTGETDGQFKDYSNTFKCINDLHTKLTTQIHNLSLLNKNYREQIKLFFDQLPDKSTLAEPLPDDITNFYTMKEFSNQFFRPYPGSQELSSQIEASVSTATPIGIESFSCEDSNSYTKDQHSDLYENFTKHLNDFYVYDNVQKLHPPLQKSHEELSYEHTQGIQKLEQIHLDVEQKQLINTLKPLMTDIQDFIITLKEQKSALNTEDGFSIEEHANEFQKHLSAIKDMSPETRNHILNEINKIENNNRFCQYLKDNIHKWNVIDDHNEYLNHLDNWRQFLKNNYIGVEKVLETFTQEIEQQEKLLEDYINPEQLGKSITTHKQTIDKITDEHLKSTGQTDKNAIEHLQKALNDSAEIYATNPFIDKLKKSIDNRIYQLDNTKEHDNTISQHAETEKHLKQWYDIVNDFNDSNDKNLTQYLSEIGKHQTALKENFDNYKDCTTDHSNYVTTMNRIKSDIDTLTHNNIENIENIEYYDEKSIKEIYDSLNVYKLNNPHIDGNPYVNKFKDALKNRLGSSSKTEDSANKDTTSHQTSDGSDHPQLSHNQNRLFSLDEKQHTLEQAQLQNLHKILRDKAGLPADNVKSLLNKVQLLDQNFAKYQNKSISRVDYSKVKETWHGNIQALIEDSIQKHLVDQDPYIVHQVYNKISEINDSIPPIENLKDFLEAIKDFPDHVDISEAVKANPDIKYRVFNLPGIEKDEDNGNALRTLQLERAKEVSLHYTEFLKGLQSNSQVTDTTLHTDITEALKQCNVIISYNEQQEIDFNKSASTFNKHIEGIFNKIGESNIESLKTSATELHTKIANSDKKLPDRQTLLDNSNIQYINKLQSAITQLKECLGDSIQENTRIEELNNHIITCTNLFEECKKNSKDRAYLYKHGKIFLQKLTDVHDYIEPIVTGLENSNPAKLYALHATLKDTKENFLLDYLKNQIEISCKNLETNDKDYHGKTLRNLKEMHGYLDKIKDSPLEDEKAKLTTGLKLNIEKDLPDAFEKYEKENVSQEKWKAREDYYKAVEECKKNINTRIDTFIKVDIEALNQFLPIWDDYLKDDRSKDKTYEEHINNVDTTKNNAKIKIDSYNSLPDKDKVKIKVKAYSDIHSSINALGKAADALPHDFQDFLDLKISSTHPDDTPAPTNSGDTPNAGDIPIPTRPANPPNTTHASGTTTRSGDTFIPTRPANPPNTTHAADTPTHPDDTPISTKRGVAFDTTHPDDTPISTKPGDINEAKIKALEQTIEVLKQTIEHEVKKALEAHGITSSKISNAADKTKKVSKVATSLLSKIKSWLRHPFSQEKRRAYLEKAISDARIDVDDAISGKGRSSQWRKVQKFLTNKWVRRSIKIVAATALVIGSLALAPKTGGASIFVGITIGAMWYYMEKNDKKNKDQKHTKKVDQKFKEVMSDKSAINLHTA